MCVLEPQARWVGTNMADHDPHGLLPVEGQECSHSGFGSKLGPQNKMSNSKKKLEPKPSIDSFCLEVHLQQGIPFFDPILTCVVLGISSFRPQPVEWWLPTTWFLCKRNQPLNVECSCIFFSHFVYPNLSLLSFFSWPATSCFWAPAVPENLGIRSIVNNAWWEHDDSNRHAFVCGTLKHVLLINQLEAIEVS